MNFKKRNRLTRMVKRLAPQMTWPEIVNAEMDRRNGAEANTDALQVVHALKSLDQRVEGYAMPKPALLQGIWNED